MRLAQLFAESDAASISDEAEQEVAVRVARRGVRPADELGDVEEKRDHAPAADPDSLRGSCDVLEADQENDAQGPRGEPDEQQVDRRLLLGREEAHEEAPEPTGRQAGVEPVESGIPRQVGGASSSRPPGNAASRSSKLAASFDVTFLTRSTTSGPARSITCSKRSLTLTSSLASSENPSGMRARARIKYRNSRAELPRGRRRAACDLGRARPPAGRVSRARRRHRSRSGSVPPPRVRNRAPAGSGPPGDSSPRKANRRPQAADRGIVSTVPHAGHRVRRPASSGSARSILPHEHWKWRAILRLRGANGSMDASHGGLDK